MFGSTYFGPTYFGASYFGTESVEVSVVTRSNIWDFGNLNSGDKPEIKIRTKTVKKEVLEKDKDEIIEQLRREDEEIIAIITTAIHSGII